MSSDNQANYTKIGFFMLTACALIVGALVYLGGFEKGEDEFLAETYFSNSVSGLDVGSDVNFRGVKIGKVKQISFVGMQYPEVVESDHRQKIHVEMSLNKKIFRIDENMNPEKIMRRIVAKGLHATVASSGITGLSRIELHYPKMKVDDKDMPWVPRTIYIPPAPSILDNASDSLTRILDQLNKINIVDMWSNAVHTISSAGLALDSMNEIMETQKGNISVMMDDLREAASNIKEFSNEVRANPASLLNSKEQPVLEETL